MVTNGNIKNTSEIQLVKIIRKTGQGEEDNWVFKLIQVALNNMDIMLNCENTDNLVPHSKCECYKKSSFSLLPAGQRQSWEKLV